MDRPTDDTPAPPGWSEAEQASIARRLEESEAQIAHGETVPLEPLLAELHALADQVEAEQQERQSAPTTAR